MELVSCPGAAAVACPSHTRGLVWQEELGSIAEYLSKVDARDNSKEEARVGTHALLPAATYLAQMPLPTAAHGRLARDKRMYCRCTE